MKSSRNPNTKSLLTIPSVAKLLGISEPTVRHLVKSKEILSVRLGSRQLIPRQTITKYLNSRLQSNNQRTEDGWQQLINHCNSNRKSACFSGRCPLCYSPEAPMQPSFEENNIDKLIDETVCPIAFEIGKLL